MPDLKIGVVGCGKQAAKHVSSLKRVPGVEILVGDTENDLAKDLAKKNNILCVEHPDQLFEDNSIHGW